MSTIGDPVGGSGFGFRLENYLRGSNSSRKTLYADVPETVTREEDATVEHLARSDVRTLADYAGYTSMLSYDHRARFVHGVAKAVDADLTLGQLQLDPSIPSKSISG